MSETTHDLRRDLAVILDRLYGLHVRPGHLDTVLEAINVHQLRAPAALGQAEQREADFHMAYRMDCDRISKAAVQRAEIAEQERDSAVTSMLTSERFRREDGASHCDDQIVSAQALKMWKERAGDAEAKLVQAEQREARIKELARVEHGLCMSIVKRLQEIGEISDASDTNVTGGIHGVIDGYVNWRASAKSAEAKLVQAEQREATARAAFLDLHEKWLKEEQEGIEALGRAETAEARLASQEATIRQVVESMHAAIARWAIRTDDVEEWADTLRETFPNS